MVDILIIGGGLAGLVNAVHLSKAGLKVLVIEKNGFPKHKVCGEYISNEVLPYLESLEILPFQFGATAIDTFLLTAPGGTQISTKLPLGGFGISRFTLDHLLYQQALANGCQVLRDRVERVDFKDDYFEVSTRSGEEYRASLVIGAYGKRSTLDIQLKRSFIKKRTPFLAVKGHYTGEFPENLVALHNFKGGYCGVSKVEKGLLNICYLTNYATFKPHRDIEAFQRAVLFQNRYLKDLFDRITPVFSQPLTISQISFSPKKTVDQHILMSGDSAGMIHPLCGNGMGMAIHSAKILSELIIRYFNQTSAQRQDLEAAYRSRWQGAFQTRLRAGRFLNFFLSNHRLLDRGIATLNWFPRLLPFIIQQTHGATLDTNRQS